MELLDQVKEDLIRHEGYRSKVYLDHLGYKTIGIGRLIDYRKSAGLSKEEICHIFGPDADRIEFNEKLRKGTRRLSREHALYLLENDIQSIMARIDGKLHAFHSWPDGVKRALINMSFQLGLNGMLNFKNMLAAIRVGNYQEAADEALKSRWAAQTPERAQEVSGWIRWA